MKKIHLLSILLIVMQIVSNAQTTHTITNPGGALSFSPDSLAAYVGDQVVFNLNFSMHPLQEVSASTWASFGSTPLAGGFSANSGNTVTITMTQPGIRYYVCAVHVAAGMRGRIFVYQPSGIEAMPSLVSLPYPNPARHMLHIIPISGCDLTYTITDILGKEVLHNSQYNASGNPVSIDVSDIAEGSYVLSVTNADGSVSKNRINISH